MNKLILGRDTPGQKQTRPRNRATANTPKEVISMNYVVYFTVSFAAALIVPTVVVETAISLGKGAYNRLTGKFAQ